MPYNLLKGLTSKTKFMKNFYFIKIRHNAYLNVLNIPYF